MDLAALIDPGLQPELLQRMPPFRESVIERTVRTACRRRSRRPESRSLAPRALLRPLGRGRLARVPNVRFPYLIAAFRAQSRLGQLSARSRLYVEGQRPAAGVICW